MRASAFARAAAAPWVVAALLCLCAFAGCGGSESDHGPSTSSAAPPTSHARKSLNSSQGEGFPAQTKHSGATEDSQSPAQARRIEGLRTQFPKPEPVAGIKGSGAAITSGRQTCQGKTPREVKEEFEDQSNLPPEQARVITRQLPRYEAEAPRDPSFVAGQLAATVYEMTLSKEVQSYGFQGCIYELARELEKRLEG